MRLTFVMRPTSHVGCFLAPGSLDTEDMRPGAPMATLMLIFQFQSVSTFNIFHIYLYSFFKKIK